MKKFIEEEISRTVNELSKNKNSDENSNLIKTLSNLKSIENDIKQKTNITNENRMLYLANTQINDDIINTVLKFAELYAAIPLLETESSMRYPSLGTNSSISKLDIISTINKIYNIELETQNNDFFTSKNIKIFDVNFIKRLFSKPYCIIYNNYYDNNSYILLNRFYSIKDFILAGSMGVEILPDYKQQYNNSINIMRLFMQKRIISHLSQINDCPDCFAYEQILMDCKIINSRSVLDLLKKFELKNLSRGRTAFILNFFDGIIADVLAQTKDINLKKLMDILPNDDSMVDYSQFNLDETVKKEFVKESKFRITGQRYL